MPQSAKLADAVDLQSHLVHEQGKGAVKAEMYREALKQTPNGFYRRQLYVLEVNLRQQQAMWVNLHHSIFYEVSPA